MRHYGFTVCCAGMLLLVGAQVSRAAAPPVFNVIDPATIQMVPVNTANTAVASGSPSRFPGMQLSRLLPFIKNPFRNNPSIGYSLVPNPQVIGSEAYLQSFGYQKTSFGVPPPRR